MLLTPRDIPQSVSVVTRQRMQDQDLQTIDGTYQCHRRFVAAG